MTKSPSDAGYTRRRLGNTGTCPQVRFDIKVLVLPTQRLVHSAADDDFVII